MSKKLEETGAVPVSQTNDDAYEYSAPRFYDFIKGESEEDIREAELWFEFDKRYAPSPFLRRIKAKRSSLKVLVACDILDSDSGVQSCLKDESIEKEPQEKGIAGEPNGTRNAENNASTAAIPETLVPNKSEENTQHEVCCNTPKPPAPSQNRIPVTASSKKDELSVPNTDIHPSVVKSKSQMQLSRMSVAKSFDAKRNANANSKAPGTHNFEIENQAIKRQKLDGGKAKQILSLKPPQPLLHKSNLCATGDPNFLLVGCNRLQKEKRKKVYVRENLSAPTPFVSMAEMMKKFQASTRDVCLPNRGSCISQSKPKLTLTRPKEPELETSQRARSIKIKSSAEIEEEMMAKISKFKARPVNRKILEAPALLPPQRSIPKPPEFQEFHFETSSRAALNSDAVSQHSAEDCHQSNNWKPCLTEPKAPALQTSMRARPPRMKSSEELEREELEKIPKFKAKPLNKKIFESKGEMGVFCNVKKQPLTIPQEFHFATDERIPPPTAVSDLFDKLSLNSESYQKGHNSLPRKTTPNPFHLQTEVRGAGKEKKFVTELIHKQVEDAMIRVPKANPYPYSTDYPVIPPKPEPKPCTKPEPFHLESLVRHEEELRKELKERERKAKEEEEMRIFKAQPLPEEDPNPLPKKVRRPLTQIQQFSLHVDQRAPERAEFDQKVKEKEMQYKRFREESEAAVMVEEEKALKQLRRTMVPHAKPVPNFENPFYPQKSSKPATRAKSPNLQVMKRKERRKFVSSSPACNMR